MTAKYDDIRYLVLKRILSLPEPLTFFDLGYLCGPNTIRTMAANGLIDVKITIKPKGVEAYEKGLLIRKKREMKKRKSRVLAPVCESGSHLVAGENGVDGMSPTKMEAA